MRPPSARIHDATATDQTHLDAESKALARGVTPAVSALLTCWGYICVRDLVQLPRSSWWSDVVQALQQRICHIHNQVRLPQRIWIASCRLHTRKQ